MLQDSCLEVRATVLLTLVISKISAGGNSFYAAEHGLACDNVVNFQVVLASAAIVDANSKTNPDLFKALKGGSNNFGIVTRFDMKTFPSENSGEDLLPTTCQRLRSRFQLLYGSLIICTKIRVHRLSEYGLMIRKAMRTLLVMRCIILNPYRTPQHMMTYYKLPNTSSSIRIDSLNSFVTELEQEGDYRYDSLYCFWKPH